MLMLSRRIDVWLTPQLSSFVDVITRDLLKICSGHTIYFYSISKKNIVEEIHVAASARNGATTEVATVPNVGELAVGDSSRTFTIFSPPSSLEFVLTPKNINNHNSNPIINRSLPQSAWKGVRCSVFFFVVRLKPLMTSNALYRWRNLRMPINFW